MIHLLKVGPKMTVGELKKLSRRYAMTGGYELALEEGLSGPDLDLMIEHYIPEALRHPAGSSMQRSCNAYRILSLIARHELISASGRNRVAPILR